MKTNLQDFEDKLVDYSHYAYYEWAGCEKVENVSEDDIKSRNYVDTVVYDKRCQKGCFSINPEPKGTRCNVELGKVNLKEPEKFGINSEATPIKRKIDTLKLLKRFELISQVFTPNQYESEEDIYIDYKVWESPEKIDKAFKTEVKHLEDNPSLAMYWLLHFGLTYDKRFDEVKQKVEQYNLAKLLPDLTQCIAFFEQIDTYYNMKVLNEEPLKHYYENLFLIRRANFLWNIYYEYEEMNEEFLENIYLSASLHKGADLRVLWRVYLLKEYVQKFDKWEWLKEKLKADKNFYLASYVLAMDPNSKDKTNLANDVLNELYKCRKLFQDHNWFYKESTNPEFFNVAHQMLEDLKDFYDDDVLFKKIIDFYIENKHSDLYGILIDTYWHRKGADIGFVKKFVKETLGEYIDGDIKSRREKTKNHALKSIGKKLEELEDEKVVALANLLETASASNRALGQLFAKFLLKKVFTINVENKEKIILSLIDENIVTSDGYEEFASFLTTLIKDDNDPNIETIFYLINNAKGSWARGLPIALKSRLSSEKVFKHSLNILKEVESDVDVYNYKLSTKAFFVFSVFTRNNLFSEDFATQSEYFVNDLRVEQINELLDVCLEKQQKAIERGKYSFLVEKIINDAKEAENAKKWFSKNDVETLLNGVNKFALNKIKEKPKPLDGLMLNMPQKTPSRTKPKSWSGGSYEKALKAAKKETFSGGIITNDKIYLVQNGVYDKDLNIFEKDLNKGENQFSFAKFPNLVSNDSRAIATCKDVPLFMAIKEGKIIYKSATSDEFVLLEDVFDSKYGVSDATFIDGKAYFSTYGGYIYAQKEAGNFEQFECISDEIRLAYFSKKHDTEAFVSMAGFSEDEIYAGGEKGILWLRENGSWRILETPLYENNNHHGEDIEHIICADDGYVYMASGGKVLKGRKDRWDVIYHYEESFTEQLVISDGKVVFLQKNYYQSYNFFVLENGKTTALKPDSEKVSIPKSSLGAKLYSNGKIIMLVGDSGAIVIENGKWKSPFHKNFDEEKMREMGLYYEK